MATKHIVGWMPNEIHLTDLLTHLVLYGYPEHKCHQENCKAVRKFEVYKKKYLEKRLITPHAGIADDTKIVAHPTGCKFFAFCKSTCMKQSEIWERI